MSSDLSDAAICYGLYDGNDIIGFCAVLHQPNSRILNLKRCSRLVILPDYQGIGLGVKFLNAIAQEWTKKGYQFSIVTSAKNMIGALNKSEKWKLIRYGVLKRPDDNSIELYSKVLRTNCSTASFKYIKQK